MKKSIVSGCVVALLLMTAWAAAERKVATQS